MDICACANPGGANGENRGQDELVTQPEQTLRFRRMLWIGEGLCERFQRENYQRYRS